VPITLYGVLYFHQLLVFLFESAFFKLIRIITTDLRRLGTTKWLSCISEIALKSEPLNTFNSVGIFENITFLLLINFLNDKIVQSLTSSLSHISNTSRKWSSIWCIISDLPRVVNCLLQAHRVTSPIYFKNGQHYDV